MQISHDCFLCDLCAFVVNLSRAMQVTQPCAPTGSCLSRINELLPETGREPAFRFFAALRLKAVLQRAALAYNLHRLHNAGLWRQVMGTLLTHVRNKVVAGAFAAIPIAIVVYLIVFAEQSTRVLAEPLGYNVPGLGLLIAVVGVLVLGL